MKWAVILVSLFVCAACGSVMQPSTSPTAFHQVGAPSKLFKNADVKSETVAVLIAGQNLRVLEYNDTWLKVETKSGAKTHTGFIQRSNVNY